MGRSAMDNPVSGSLWLWMGNVWCHRRTVHEAVNSTLLTEEPFVF